MALNREQRRKLKKLKNVKPSVEDWTCPNCSAHYDYLFVQSKAEPYLFCHNGCEEYFSLTGENVTKTVFPNGKPF